MSRILPPYLNKMVEKYEKELLVAEERELKAKKNLEFATEYKELCREKLENAKKQK